MGDFVKRALVALLRRGSYATFALRVCGSAAVYYLSRRRRERRGGVILHVGQHKTGTTSIQAFLGRQRSVLAKQGIHPLRTGQGADGAHHHLIYRLDGRPLRRLSSALIKAEFLHAEGVTILLSSEVAKEVVDQGRGQQLIEALRAVGAGDVHVLLYVRSPFAFANALYSQQTSAFTAGGANFVDYLRSLNHSSYFEYENFLNLARRENVALTVRPYDESARRSAVADFLKAIDVNLPAIEEPRLNRSFGPVALEAMRVLGEEIVPLKRDEIGKTITIADLSIRYRLRDRLREIAGSIQEEPFWGMDPEHEALLAAADRRTDEFARAVWGRGWREVIGDEHRAKNVYDPQDPAQERLYRHLVHEMRAAKREMTGSRGTPDRDAC